MSDVNKKIINLKYSIPIPNKDGNGTTEVNSITLGRFKAKHIKLLPEKFEEYMEDDAKNLSISEIVPIIAGLADIPLESAEEIDLEDIETISEGLIDFLSVYLETGKKQSGQ